MVGKVEVGMKTSDVGKGMIELPGSPLTPDDWLK